MKTKLLFALIIVTFLFPFTMKAQTDYAKLWKRVDSLETKNLPKSALTEVENLYEKAKKENNSQQIIKAVIFKLKFRNSIEENAFEKVCYELDSLAQKLQFPENAIMHGMLADMYWWYIANNRWKFYDRTNTVNFENNDMKTWTLDFLAHKIISQYDAALENAEGLQKISIQKFPELIIKGTNDQKLRPTLYDFLANKAIDFYSKNEIAVTKPADNYQLTQEFYFFDLEKFILQNIKSDDTLSLHYNAMKITRDLLKFRLEKKSEIEALINADINRIDLVYKFSVHPGKDELYFEALKNLRNKHKDGVFAHEIEYKIAEYYYNRASKFDANNRATYEYKFYKKKAYDICKSIIQNAPKSYPGEKSKALLYNIENHTLSFDTEDLIPSNTNFVFKLDYTNIDKIYYKIAKIDPAKYEKLSEKLYGKELYDKLFAQSENISENSKELPQDIDFNKHSTEIVNNGLNYGMYVIFVSNNSKFQYKQNISSFKIFTVTDLSYIKQSNESGTQNIVVLNRKSGMPVAGATVKTWSLHYDYKLKKYIKTYQKPQKTDINGACTISEELNKANTYYIEILNNEDFLPSISSIYLSSYRTNKNIVNDRIHIFTDRAIYRPGQTIFYKAVYVRTQNNEPQIVTNTSVYSIFSDPNYQEIAKTTLKTNEYGSLTGSFEIPLGRINGNYTIQIGNSSINVSVEEYKRPTFEVSMLPFDGQYKLEDSVSTSGIAKSYSGAPLSDAKVQYSITRSPKWRGWRYWFFAPTVVQVAQGTSITDENGKFIVAFKAWPDLAMPKSEFSYFNYQIKVDITDLNGETQSVSKSIAIGYTSLIVELPLNEYIDKSEKQSDLTISSLNLNGEKVNAAGTITFFELKDNKSILKSRYWAKPDKYLYDKQQWDSIFPQNVFEDEDDIRNLEKGKQVYTQSFDTQKNKKFNIAFINKLNQGRYVAEIESKDVFGNKVTNKHFFNVFDKTESKTPFVSSNIIIPLNTSCEPGQNAEFYLASSYSDLNILYQIEHKDSIISSEYIKLNNSTKVISIPVTEKHRGNFSVHFVFVKDNRSVANDFIVNVPYSNKKLDIEFETFRDKLQPGEKEEWKIKIKGPKGDKVAAEMLAELYDASLDEFKSHNWAFNIYNSYYTQRNWSTECFGSSGSQTFTENFNKSHYVPYKYYDQFNWYNFSYYSGYLYDTEYEEAEVTSSRRRSGDKKTFKVAETSGIVSADEDTMLPPVTDGLVKNDRERSEDKSENGGETKIRTNFNETAFFYPLLKTDNEGNIIVSFTIPESLTKWKMNGFAHTKNLEYGFIQNELITQKEIMLMPNAPRFLRENDKMTFPVKITNITDKMLVGEITLEFFDAISMKPITNIIAKNDKSTKSFQIKANSNIPVSWKLEIPDNLGTVTYRVVAKAGKYSDGEQKALPVLTNRMLVTESLPLPVKGSGTATFSLNKLVNSNKSTTIKNHKLTLEFTSNPAWYAVQALPYLIEYPYECTEQTFSRFYANSIASHIANSNPKIKRVFDEWKNTDSKELLSNLEKNQELKAVLLQESPWVLEGQSESARKKRVGLLFDLNRMSNELSTALLKIQNAQQYNGGWPWFKGMPESRYITQHIVTGMGHLDKLGVKSIKDDSKSYNMIVKAVRFLDEYIAKDYKYLLKYYNKEQMKENHLSYYAIQYMYAVSFFPETKRSADAQTAFDYYLSQAEKYWTSQSLYMQAMLAIVLHRNQKSVVAADIVKSLKERAIVHKELGMYWKDNAGGWYWYQAPIETQALMIEVFSEVAKDKVAVYELKVWLLKQKQTQDWKTTKATTEAVYALLMQGDDLLANDEIPSISLGNKPIDTKSLKIEAGTGYFKTSWSGNEIVPEMGKVKITKTNDGLAWGALYWQYFEDLDKITPHETPLKLKKQLFIERVTERGKIIEPISNSILKIGDKVIVRIELRVDRDMEYVHMKDMRASGFEPINVISQYKYQGAIGYYESTKDASTNFFIEYLRKGTYVFEYPLRVTHKGDFSNGITTIQCMYAPEFTSHSEGIRVNIKE